MTFNVLLVGAGEINFGSVEGPWNHSRRLESKLGKSLRVVGLVDPDQSRAAAALEGKLASEVAPAYVSCRAFSTVSEAAAALSDDLLPQLAVVGAPPFARGSDLSGKDLELQLTSAFPGCALFVEKPVSSGPVDGCWRVAAELDKRRTLVGVGYMLRYSKAVQMMKQIIKENNLVVMGTNARYVMAYEWARKLSWWNKDSSGGPIVEQATHFCDLSRYFGGDVVLPSVSAHIVSHDEAPGALSAKRFDETAIPPEKRLPRLTSATWKYAGGAVGALTHVIALHGATYDTEFEVYADGYRLKLIDPYGSTPVLSVRRPGVAGEEMHTFPDDDPFYSELSTIIDAIREPNSGARSSILSSYEDAVKTYELTWQIRRAGEK
ncbi:putative oxidoreductase C terminal-domain-containing protein [Rhodofomes roseus]|uniref:Oxidoreductase C terminal-domain-containing protein n=1 Tax=Rhodofomes roseus TaxID=34475 RepID=A0ABQ8KT74_9APHY|nr:putative oxidoreductase C terminal-domain-containing protein [Rhodofomes roseus]KAH9841957.1 putative oxidoreductase C terminal-domain-containing protein [Rhodofomes roseus]